MADLEETLEPTPGDKKGGKKKILILALLFVIVAGAGAGVFFLRDRLWSGGEDVSPFDREQQRAVTGPPRATGFMLPVAELTVNLADADSYIRFSMQLEMRDQGALDMGQQRMAMIRDAIIMAMTTRTAADIRDDMQNNLNRAKGDILSRLNGVLGEGAVERIFIENIMIT